jgi:hypothetical protein
MSTYNQRLLDASEAFDAAKDDARTAARDASALDASKELKARDTQSAITMGETHRVLKLLIDRNIYGKHFNVFDVKH